MVDRSSTNGNAKHTGEGSRLQELVEQDGRGRDKLGLKSASTAKRSKANLGSKRKRTESVDPGAVIDIDSDSVVICSSGGSASEQDVSSDDGFLAFSTPVSAKQGTSADGASLPGQPPWSGARCRSDDASTYSASLRRGSSDRTVPLHREVWPTAKIRHFY